MLLLKPLFTVNRVTVFGDHADPDQFYYLPETVHLSTNANGEPDFTLLKYMRDITDNPAWAEGQQLGGGFLTFSVDLSLDDDTRMQILRQAGRFSDAPRLVSAPFRDGTVRILALDATDQPVQGRIRFVENVYGTTKPSLFGDLKATFSLELSQEGAVLLEKAFAQGGQPIGVVYELKFLGLRPAFDVKVHADYKKIYDEFSAQLAGQYMMIRAEVDAGFQKLIENKAIDIVVNSYTDDADARQQRDNALKFITDDLLKTFFSPSLNLPAAQSSAIVNSLAPALNLPQAAGRTLSQANAGATPTPGPNTRATQPATGATSANLLPSIDTLARSAAAGAIQALTGNNPSNGTSVGTAPAAQPPAGKVGAGATGQTGITGATQPPPVTGGAGGTPPAAGGAGATPPAAGGAQHPPATAPAQGQKGTPTGNRTNPAPAAGNAGSSSGLSIGLTLRYMHEEELKTLDVSWKESSAVEQIHSPNGTFGVMLRGVDKSRHFMPINLDDDFFQRIKVMVDCPTPFASLGLDEVTVHLEYGNRGDGQPKYVDDVELKPDAQGHVTPQEFTTSLDAARRLNYRYRVDLFFDPGSNIRGQKTHYTTEMFSSIDRSLVIDPESYVGLLKVNAAVGDMNWDDIPRVQVKVGYDDDPNNLHVQDSFVLTKDKPTFDWMVRLTDPKQVGYWYEVTFFLKDDQNIKLPRQNSLERNLVINEPWQDRLNLLLDAELTSSLARLIVEVDYQDTDAGYRYSSVRRITGVADVPANLSIPILDRNKRSYRYQVTAVGTDNSVRRGSTVSAEDSYLLAASPS